MATEKHIHAREFDPKHVYVNDEGVVACGEHVGIEATYTPWAWSDVTKYAAKDDTLKCERCERTPKLWLLTN